MGKPRRQKKSFKDCGHRGFGKYCHRCKQLEEAELDGNVLKVLKNYPGYKLRPGQIVKLMHGKNHNYHNSDIPDFFEQANHVRDSLHRLERVGHAVCEQVEHEGRSKRWRFTPKTNAKKMTCADKIKEGKTIGKWGNNG